MTFNLTECSKNTIYSMFYFTMILVRGCVILKSSGRLWNDVLLFQVRSRLLQQVIDKPNSARLTARLRVNYTGQPAVHTCPPMKMCGALWGPKYDKWEYDRNPFSKLQQFLPPQILLLVLFREQVMEQNSKLVNSNSVSEVEYLHCIVHHLCIVFNYI